MPSVQNVFPIGTEGFVTCAIGDKIQIIGQLIRRADHYAAGTVARAQRIKALRPDQDRIDTMPAAFQRAADKSGDCSVAYQTNFHANLIACQHNI
jgi:hypothetical protein